MYKQITFENVTVKATKWLLKRQNCFRFFQMTQWSVVVCVLSFRTSARQQTLLSSILAWWLPWYVTVDLSACPLFRVTVCFLSVAYETGIFQTTVHCEKASNKSPLYLQYQTNAECSWKETTFIIVKIIRGTFIRKEFSLNNYVGGLRPFYLWEFSFTSLCLYWGRWQSY